MKCIIWTFCLIQLLGWPCQADDSLGFITPPIELKDTGIGVCTGDRSSEFTDARGQRVLIMTSHTPTIDKSIPAMVLVRDPFLTIVHGSKVIEAPDGGKVQERILKLISEAADKIRSGKKLDKDQEWRLRQLEIWIEEINSRQAGKGAN